jgi:hypothetical protein
VAFAEIGCGSAKRLDLTGMTGVEVQRLKGLSPSLLRVSSIAPLHFNIHGGTITVRESSLTVVGRPRPYMWVLARGGRSSVFVPPNRRQAWLPWMRRNEPRIILVVGPTIQIIGSSHQAKV